MKIGNRDARTMLTLALAVVLAAGCSSGGKTRAPSIYVTATGDLATAINSVTNDMTLSFAPGGGQITFVIGNTGDAPMEILKVEVASLNDYMAVAPNLAGLSFPQTVEAGEIRTTDKSVLKLKVVFTPGPVTDDKPTTLRITTTDYSYAGGVFEFDVTPQEKEPVLSVNPPNYTFLNATGTSTDTVDIVLSNTGTEALVLGDIYFENGATAYKIIAGRPNVGTIIDPEGTGSSNGARTLTVEYSPVEPPDLARMVVEWGKVVETGVSCSGDSACRNSTLCSDKTKECPYICGNGHCMCQVDEDCKAYLCEDPANCDTVCMSGVCRSPGKAFVELQGKVVPGQLLVQYGDELAGCMDFTTVTDPGTTCTKLVKLFSGSEGMVTLDNRPVTRVGEGFDNPYTVEWYQPGAIQEAECGAVNGTVIPQGRFSLTETNGPVNVAVTYTAPEGKAPNGELVIAFNAPYAGEKVVGLCGGFKKGELEVAPLPTLTRNVVLFAPEPSKVATKTVVLMNKGNEVLTLKNVSAVSVNDSDPEGFSVLNPPAGADLLMQPGALIPLTVQFDGNKIPLDENSDSVVLNGYVVIEYVDPLNGTDTEDKVNLVGWVNVKNVTLPTADPGDASDYTGIKVNDSLVLDASGSVAGTFPIPSTSGYIWFISGKPDTSKVFTNPGPGPSRVTVIPDVAGTYEFRLVVFSYDTDSNLSFYSEETVLTVNVAPAS